MIDTHIPIAQIMTRKVVAVAATDFMDQVADIFAMHNFHHLPVLTAGRIVGIISAEDVYKIEHYFTIYNLSESVEFNKSFLRSVPVIDVMKKQVVTLWEQDSISLAVDVFRKNLFHALPIVDNEGNLTGMLTTYDLLNYAFNDANQIPI